MVAFMEEGICSSKDERNLSEFPMWDKWVHVVVEWEEFVVSNQCGII